MKAMKVLAAMFVAAAMFSFTGCSKDEKTVDKNDVVGNWNLETMVLTRTISGLTGEYAVMNGTQSQNVGPDEGESSIFTFNSDGTCIIQNNFQEGNETSTGTWSVSGNNLIWDLVDEEGVADHQVLVVEEVSSTQMVLSASKSVNEEMVPGQVAKIDMRVEIHLSKM